MTQAEQMSGQAGATAAVARFISEEPREAIAEELRARAKKVIADTVGVIIAGTASDAGGPLLRYAAQSPAGDCAVIGTEIGIDAESAALVNGALGHALDFDDVVSIMPGHPSAVVVAALLSARSGTVSGTDFIDAYVIGIEVGVQLGRSIGVGHYQRGWHATGTIGAFAALGAVARLWKLDLETIRRALGIAASMAGGLQKNFGTMTKPLHSGLAARTGVVAARLAATGLTANEEIFETTGGFFSVYGDERSSADRVAEYLGKPYVFMEPGITLKKYPCCYAVHRGIDGVLELAEEIGLAADTVASVECAVPPGALRPLLYDRPVTGLEGKFSMQYALATTLLDGSPNLASFTDEAVNRPEARSLLELMNVREDPRCSPGDPDGKAKSPGTLGFIEVTGRLGDGTASTARIDKPIGSPERPLSWEDVRAKFDDCLSTAGLPEASVAGAFGKLRELERVPDVTAGLLASP